MIGDTSSVVAVIKGEAGREEIDSALAAADPPRMSGTYQELGIVVDRQDDLALGRRLDRLLEAWGVVIEPVTSELAQLGRAAYRDVGRGSGHPARLNVGDCFAYALASLTGEPLLCVGEDFSATDLMSARLPSTPFPTLGGRAGRAVTSELVQEHRDDPRRRCT